MKDVVHAGLYLCIPIPMHVYTDACLYIPGSICSAYISSTEVTLETSELLPEMVRCELVSPGEVRPTPSSCEDRPTPSSCEDRPTPSSCAQRVPGPTYLHMRMYTMRCIYIPCTAYVYTMRMCAHMRACVCVRVLMCECARMCAHARACAHT